MGEVGELGVGGGAKLRKRTYLFTSSSSKLQGTKGELGAFFFFCFFGVIVLFSLRRRGLGGREGVPVPSVKTRPSQAKYTLHK